MRKPLFALLCLFALAAMGCRTTPQPRVKGQPKPQPRSDAPLNLMQSQTISPPVCLDTEVMLTIQTDKLSYKVGEPVEIEMRLNNLSRDRFKCFYVELYQEGFLFTLDISRDGVPVYRSPIIEVDPDRRPASLSHYAWVPSAGFLGMRYSGWRPDSPGTYRLAAQYVNEKFEIVLASMRFSREQVDSLGERAYVPVWTGRSTSNVIEITATK